MDESECFPPILLSSSTKMVVDDIIHQGSNNSFDIFCSLSEPSEVPEIKGRKIVGVGFGPSIFESGHIVLRPVNPVSPPRDKQPIMPPSKV